MSFEYVYVISFLDQIFETLNEVAIIDLFFFFNQSKVFIEVGIFLNRVN